MAQTQPNAYLRTQILTASPQQLRLMLYDGALRFCRAAKQALTDKKYEESFNQLSKAQAIVLELGNSLNKQIEPELCSRLESLYNFLYRKLVEANMNRDPAVVDEALGILEYERETWVMLMKKTMEQKSGNTLVQPIRPAAGCSVAV